MINADESQVLAMFTKVHGALSPSCNAEVIYDDEFDIVGVACLKNGYEAWRATLAEITFDLAVMRELSP